jgi:hypothetical protein
MPASTQSKIIYTKLRGRPPGAKYSESFQAKFEPGTVADIDMWATANGVSRAEALRRLVEIGLMRTKEAAVREGFHCVHDEQCSSAS